MQLSHIILIVSVIGFSAAEVVNFRACTEYVGLCEINEVKIEPCPEAADNKACKIKRGRTVTMEFDYTPEFNANNLTGQAYWASEDMDLPFLGMDTDACKFTTCPVVSGQRQKYTFVLPLRKKFPARPYDLKWKLHDGDNGCCFITSIEIKN